MAEARAPQQACEKCGRVVTAQHFPATTAGQKPPYPAVWSFTCPCGYSWNQPKTP
jgi:hypothetical protein